MEINDKIIEKLEKVGSRIKTIQDTNDRLEKQYDGLDLDNIKDNSAEAAKNLEEIQDIKLKMEAQEKANKERADMLEIELAKKGASLDSVEEERKEKLNAYKNAMGLYLKSGETYPLPKDIVEYIAESYANTAMHGATKEAKISYQKAMVVGVQPSTGYWVLPDRVAEIAQRIFETSPLRGLAMVRTTTSNMVSVPLDDQEIGCGWVGEVQERPETSTPLMAEVSIPIHESYAMPSLSQEALDDSGFDVEGWLTEKVSSKLSRKENEAFINGDGSKKPRGILDYPAWANPDVYEREAIGEREATGDVGQLTNAGDLINLQSDLLEFYDVNANWCMKRKTFADIMTLKDDYGQYLLDPMMIKTGTSKVLLGSPVVFMADMPSIAADATPILYGDFREGYTIVDRFGIRVIRDFYTKKPYTLLYTTKRLGGAITNFQAIKRLRINSA
jgi:HK97 family phage major capsid protein